MIKLLPYILFEKKIYSYVSVRNGQPREPACVAIISAHMLVPYSDCVGNASGNNCACDLHTEVRRAAVITSLGSASSLRCERDTARICCRAPALRSKPLRSIDGTDRRTYRRTFGCFIETLHRILRGQCQHITT